MADEDIPLEDFGGGMEAVDKDYIPAEAPIWATEGIPQVVSEENLGEEHTKERIAAWKRETGLKGIFG